MKEFIIITSDCSDGYTFDNVYSFIDFIYKCVWNKSNCKIRLDYERADSY